MNLISKWMDFTAQSESPDSYHIWCALSTIASVIRRQVWVDMGFFNVYPNLYVVLVGPPGCRKSTPINISVDILSTFSDVHVSADATTREALIRAVKVAENPIELNNGKIYIQSPITIVSKELSVFIGTGNNDLLALLTDLYDCVSANTEILTNNGWRTIDTMQETDKALTLNTQTDLLEYKTINFITKKLVPGIVQFKSVAINQAMSPNHNVLFKYRGWPGYKKRKAISLVGVDTEIQIPLSGTVIKEEIRVPDEVIALTGWCITDGSVYESFAEIYQGERKLRIILNLLDKLGIKYSVYPRKDGGFITQKPKQQMFTVHISKSELFMSYIARKEIPPLYKNMSARQFDIFLDALMMGDGHWNVTGKQGCLTVSSKKLLDDLQEMAVQYGWSTICGKFYRNTWPLSFNKKKFSSFLGGNYRSKEVRRQYIPGEQQVWCINTDNETVLIRKDGHVSITGNCPHRWEYRTKHSGIDTLTGVWVNMLAASTPEWLRSSIPLTAIGGGFTSRVVFVVEYTPRHRRSMPRLTADEEKLKQEIARDLEAISIKRGEMKMDAEAFMLFDKWYNTIAADNKCTDTMFKGYFDKKHIQLIKVAMLAALSKDRDVIDITDIEFGLKMLNTAEINMLEAFGAVGRSTMASNIHDAEMFIKEHKTITRQKLLGMMWRDVEPQYFDSVITMLRDMGKVLVRPDKDGGFIYTWIHKEEI